MSDELGYISKDKLFLALVASDAFSNLPEMLSILGEEKFLEFVELFGGQTVTLPKLEDIANAVRDVVIQEKAAQGVKTYLLSEQYGLSQSQVRRIVARVAQSKNFGAQGVANNA